jgi:ketosteroid isomerase-like protein
MNIHDVAKDLVALLKAGKFEECGEKYWAEDVVSIEPGGPAGMDPVSKGKAAVEAKGKWWSDNHETESLEVEGPYVNGDQFTCRFKMKVKVKATGQVMDMDEHALYTLKDGKIVEEKFFYSG